jgi:hypothetical protein
MHPDTFDHRYIRVNGIRMHYVQAGVGEHLSCSVPRRRAACSTALGCKSKPQR